MESIDIVGIDNLIEAFKTAKENNFDFFFGYGSRTFDVIDIQDDRLVIKFKSFPEKEMPFNNLTDEWGEIFYFYVKEKDGDGEVMVNFDFTPEEKERFSPKMTARELAQQDFEDIASPDEQELYENRNKDLRTFIKNEVLKIHKKVMLETEKLKINKKMRLLKEDTSVGDTESMVNSWLSKLELFIEMLDRKSEILRRFPVVVGTLSEYFNDEIVRDLEDERYGDLKNVTQNDYDDLLEKKVDNMSTQELINVVGVDLLDADVDKWI